MAALYIHIPVRLGERRSSTSVPSDEESAYVAVLLQEMDRYRQSPFVDAEFESIYVGGERASLLSLHSLERLLPRLHTSLDAASVEEVTLELNPADASLDYLQGLRDLGVTRLCVRAGSFVSADLSATGVPHTVDEIDRALDRIRTLGFERLSVDLTFGRRDRPLARWKANLQGAVDRRIPHVAIEESLSNPDEANRHAADCLAFAMHYLPAKGLEQYELTHFARPSHRSAYQENYYAHGNVLALGAGAESFWWSERNQNTTAHRWSNVEDVMTYRTRIQQGNDPAAETESLDRRSLAREYILLRLRVSDGLDLDVLADRYGYDLRSQRERTLERLAAEGLIDDYEPTGRVRLRPRGRLLTDAITSRLLPSM